MITIWQRGGTPKNQITSSVPLSFKRRGITPLAINFFPFAYFQNCHPPFFLASFFGPSFSIVRAIQITLSSVMISPDILILPSLASSPRIGSTRHISSLWLLSICSASSSRRGGPVSTGHDHAETEMGLSYVRPKYF
jgi:hypothetical protein